MADGFLGRWARRKEAVRQGKEPPPEVPEAEAGAVAQEPGAVPSATSGEATAARPEDSPPPPPTLEDTHALTADSDFTRFVKPEVAPEVKNAAMKKLFADPHFNVMDGLDVYIDDYSKPDPIPPEMLRQLASAAFLKLFDEPEEKEKAEAGAEAANAPMGGEVADHPPSDSVAQSSTRTGQALPPAEDHADPDLRLQQDDAPGPPGPGQGAG
jgi:hypothetical protein